MSGRDILMPWIIDALRSKGGQATITDVARHIWKHHESELAADEELFYSWQYEMRWAAGKLRDAGRIKSPEQSPKGIWALSGN